MVNISGSMFILTGFELLGANSVIDWDYIEVSESVSPISSSLCFLLEDLFGDSIRPEIAFGCFQFALPKLSLARLLLIFHCCCC